MDRRATVRYKITITMCFGGREKGGDEAGAARSRELDKIIRADEKKMSKEVKLLLLGMRIWLSTSQCSAMLTVPQVPVNLESRRC